ncbi:MAG: hypothetical protein HY823_13565 [Acidobacteria bacterium]|nr:hypothetical protein [Acidobacteriota bacterium]
MKVPIRLASALLLCAAALLAGDLTIVSKNSGKFNEGTSTQYYSASFQRHNHEGTKTDQLTDFKAGVMYTIKHKDRKIEKMSFDDLAAAAEGMEAQMAKMKEQMANMPEFLRKTMGMDADSVSVEEVEKDTVAGRKCRVYKVVVGKLQMELANDPTLTLPISPEAWARFGKLRGMAMGGGMGGYKKLYEEMSKLKGVTLRSRSTFPIVGEMVTEAVEVKEGPIPAAVFALPEGYKVEDVGKKLVEQSRKAR